MADNAELAKVGLGTVSYGGRIVGIITGDVTVAINKEVYKLRAGIGGGIPLLTHKQWVVGLAITLSCKMMEITRDNLSDAVGIGVEADAGLVKFLHFGLDSSLKSEALEFIHTDHNGLQSGYHFHRASPSAETTHAFHEAAGSEIPATWEVNANLNMAAGHELGYFWQEVAVS